MIWLCMCWELLCTCQYFSLLRSNSVSDWKSKTKKIDINMSGASVPSRGFAACSVSSSMRGTPIAIQWGRAPAALFPSYVAVPARAGCTHSQHVHRIQEASRLPCWGCCAPWPCQRRLLAWLRVPQPAFQTRALSAGCWLGRAALTAPWKGPWGCTSSTFFYSGINMHAVLKEGKIRLRSCGHLNKRLTWSVSSCKSVKWL